MHVSSLDGHNHFTVFFTSKYYADPGETSQLLKFLKPHKHGGLSFLSWFSWQTPCQNLCPKKNLDIVVQAYNTCNTKASTNKRIFFWRGGQSFYPNWWDVGHLVTVSKGGEHHFWGWQPKLFSDRHTKEHMCTHTWTNICTCTEASKNTLF